ncbi:hypothetical protein [uncultured Fibrella sp.]|uniref:hypothetical protein n=1 Tax=uncultured Fibrella sp. TaxID=1284596 RepID=UPI0035CB6227
MDTSLETFHRQFPGKPLPTFAGAQVDYLRDIKSTHNEPAEGVVVELDKVVGLFDTHVNYFKKGYSNHILPLTWLQLLDDLRRGFKYSSDDIEKIDDDLLNSRNVSPGSGDAISLRYLVSEDKYFIASGVHRITYLKFRGDRSSFFCEKRHIVFGERC